MLQMTRRGVSEDRFFSELPDGRFIELFMHKGWNRWVYSVDVKKAGIWANEVYEGLGWYATKPPFELLGKKLKMEVSDKVKAYMDYPESYYQSWPYLKEDIE